jgi:hypothetical protein
LTVIVVNAAVRKDAFAEDVASKLASVTKSSKAITVAGTGEAHGRPGAENMAAIANMLGKVTAYLGRSNLQITSVGKPFHNTTMHA